MFDHIRESFRKANETVEWARQEVAEATAKTPVPPKPAPRRPIDTKETQS